MIGKSKPEGTLIEIVIMYKKATGFREVTNAPSTIP